MIVSATPAYGVYVALIVCIAGVVVAPVAARVLARRFDPFEPIVLFAVAYGVMFVVRPVAMLVEDSLRYEGPRRALDVSETFGDMLVLALLGAVAFVLGYSLPAGLRLAARHHSPRLPRSDGRLLLVGLAVGLLGLASYLLVLASVGFTDWVRAVLRAGNTEIPELTSTSIYASFLFLLLIPATLVVLSIGLDRRRHVVVAVAACLVVVVVAFSLPLGSRITLLPLLGGLYAFYYVRRAKRPSAWSILALVAAAVVVSAFLSDLRGRATRDEGVLQTVERTFDPSRLVHSVTTGPDTEMAPVLAAALAIVPDRLSHTYGTTVFGDLVVRPIPRSAWSGKPLTPRQELISTIWPVEYERRTVNVEFSPLLYFYWDFGLLGVAVGLAAYGILGRYLFEYFRLNHTHRYAQILYSLAIWFVVIGVRDGPVDMLVRATFVVAPVWVIFAIARVPLGARVDPALEPEGG